MSSPIRVRPYEWVNRICDVVLQGIAFKVVARAQHAGIDGKAIASNLSEKKEKKTEALVSARDDVAAVAKLLDLSELLHLLEARPEIRQGYKQNNDIKLWAKKLRDLRNDASHQTVTSRVTEDKVIEAFIIGRQLLNVFNGSGAEYQELEQLYNQFQAYNRRSLDTAPSVPRTYQPPQSYAHAREELISRRRLLIRAMGGAGKTLLARQLCDDQLVKVMVNGEIWLVAGQSKTSREITTDLARYLDLDIIMLTLELLKVEIKARLSERTLLIIIDDIWTSDQLHDVIDLLGSSYLIVTSRSGGFATEFDLYLFELQPLERSQSIALLEKESNGKTKGIAQEKITRLLDRVFDHPQSVVLAARNLRNTSVEKYLNDLSVISLHYGRPQDDHSNVVDTIRLSILPLSSQAKKLLSAGASLVEDIAVPKTVFQALSIGLLGVNQASADQVLSTLVDAGLITVSSALGVPSYNIHDLIRETALMDLEPVEPQVTASAILDGYLASNHTDQFAQISDDGYIYDHLIELIYKGGRSELVHQLFETDEWFIARLKFNRAGLGIVDFARDVRSVFELESAAAVEDGSCDTSSHFVRLIGYKALLSGLELATLNSPEFYAFCVQTGDLEITTAIALARQELWAWDRLRLAWLLLKNDLTDYVRTSVLDLAEQNLPEAIGTFPKEPLAPVRSGRENLSREIDASAFNRLDHWYLASEFLEFFPDLKEQIIEGALSEANRHHRGVELVIHLVKHLSMEQRALFPVFANTDELLKIVTDPTYLWFRDISFDTANKFDWADDIPALITELISSSELQNWAVQGLLLLLPSVPANSRSQLAGFIVEKIGGWIDSTEDEMLDIDNTRFATCLLLAPFMDKAFLRTHLDAHDRDGDEQFVGSASFPLLLAHESVAAGEYRLTKLSRRLTNQLETDKNPASIPALVKLATVRPAIFDDIVDIFVTKVPDSHERYQRAAIELMWVAKGDDFDRLFETFILSISTNGTQFKQPEFNPFVLLVLNRLSLSQRERLIAVLDPEESDFADIALLYLKGKVQPFEEFAMWFYFADWDALYGLNQFTFPDADDIRNPRGWRSMWYGSWLDSDQHWRLFLSGSYYMVPSIPEQDAEQLMQWLLRLLTEWRWSGN